MRKCIVGVLSISYAVSLAASGYQSPKSSKQTPDMTQSAEITDFQKKHGLLDSSFEIATPSLADVGRATADTGKTASSSVFSMRTPSPDRKKKESLTQPPKIADTDLSPTASLSLGQAGFQLEQAAKA